jgi:hypothetical protein
MFNGSIDQRKKLILHSNNGNWSLRWILFLGSLDLGLQK